MYEDQIRVHNLPRSVGERELAGSAVIVIDLLRATSTICQALASGARDAVPFLEIDDALAAARNTGRAEVVLGGERSGGKIPGFDIGNSPSEYTREVVDGKRLFITTTNGTRAMHHARFANRVLLGSFLNLSAVVASVKDEPQIDILCAGTDGHETDEDIMAAGAIVNAICNDDCALPKRTTDEQAVMAREQWRHLESKAMNAGRSLNDELATALRNTAGGRNLLGIGLDQDLVDCAQIDSIAIVPELDVRAWRIVAAPA